MKRGLWWKYSTNTNSIKKVTRNGRVRYLRDPQYDHIIQGIIKILLTSFTSCFQTENLSCLSFSKQHYQAVQRNSPLPLWWRCSIYHQHSSPLWPGRPSATTLGPPTQSPGVPPARYPQPAAGSQTWQTPSAIWLRLRCWTEPAISSPAAPLAQDLPPALGVTSQSQPAATSEHRELLRLGLCSFGMKGVWRMNMLTADICG